jgi:hypothetical protein
MTIAVFVFSLLGAMALGMPIAYALLVCGLSLMAYMASNGMINAFDSQILAQRFVDGADNFPLLAVPFFVLAGHMMNKTGITERLISCSKVLVSWMAGGLAQVGFVAWFAGLVGGAVQGVPVTLALVVLVVVFYLSHYVFASVTAHVTALLPVMLTVGAAIPDMPMKSLTLALCRRLDIPATRIHGIDSLPQHPHLQAVGLFQPQQHPTVGPIVAVRPTTLFGRTPADLALHAPTLGEHSAQVLQQAGFSATEIRSLQDNHTITTTETTR